MKTLYSILLLLVCAGLLVYGCSKSSSGYNNTTPPPTGGSTSSSISMSMMSFSPGQTTVAVGTTVTWTNNDNMNHTVTANDGSFDSGAILPGKTFTHTFSAKGTVNYHCTFHSGMTGSVIVQ